MRGEQSLDSVVQQKREFDIKVVRKRRELEIIEKHEFEKLKRQLGKTRGPVVVAFIDLCGSTELKRLPQEKWLPIVGEFLLDVTQCANRKRGRVIKYIGDEVLALFDGAPVKVITSRAEEFVRECEAALRNHGNSTAKYAFDIGRIVPVSVPGGASDVLGTCVDRCARIAKLLSPGTALASLDFVNMLTDQSAWRKVATVRVKGIDKPFEICQLKGVGPRISGGKIRERVISGAELAQRSIRLGRQLKVCREELGRFRRR